MAAPPPPPPTPGKGANIVSGKVNPYLRSGTSEPELFNSSINPITYNGFQWNFTSPVTWGRFISGEPFVIAPSGVVISGVSYDGLDLPRLVTGYTSAQTQANNVGITFHISGSMKNPKPFWEQTDFNFTRNAGATIFSWNYDERACDQSIERKGQRLVTGALVNYQNPFSEFLFFPAGLSAGDVLVTAKSSFNESPSQSERPQGKAMSVLWTNPDMNRMCIEKYGILTILPTSPTYADCYRPPVFWNGASLADRPIFYRHDMTKNTEDYLIEIPEKTIKGDLINYEDENIIKQVNDWNSFVTEYWPSSHIPYYSGAGHQMAVSAYDLYNDDPNTYKTGYMGIGAKIKDQMLHSIFAPWVSSANRRIALDKSVQFSIDCFGIPHGKGIAKGEGGYHAAAAHPWIQFLGFLYNRNDITKYYRGSQIQSRLAPGYTGAYALLNTLVPMDIAYKALLTQDYSQRYKVIGCGVTNNQGYTGWISTNSNISLYHGLTTPSQSASGACGFGWLYKFTGITCAYSYTQTNINLDNTPLTGSFGVVVLHRDTVFRLNGLGEKSGRPGPAELPLKLTSSGSLAKRGFQTTKDVGHFWSFDDGAMRGMNLEIESGPGAGATAYRILYGYNHFVKRGKIQNEAEEEEEGTNDLGVLSTLQYPTFVLDRDFDAGAPTSQSRIKIYPTRNNETVWGFSIKGWLADLNEEGITRYGSENNTIYQQTSYNNIADEAIIKNYAIHHLLGITEDQFMIDYVRDVYFDENLPDYTRRQKVIGSAYVGYIFDDNNSLGGALIAKIFGLTGEQFFPRTVRDLDGIYDNDPSVALDDIQLEFSPEPIVNYKVPGGSGITFNGYGKIFNEPQTILKIKAIIDNKIFTDIAQPGLYSLMKDLKVQFGPFLTNKMTIDDNTSSDAYKDRLSVYDFGDVTFGTITNVTRDDAFMRKLPSFRDMYLYNTPGGLTAGGVVEDIIASLDPATLLTQSSNNAINSSVNTYTPLQKVKIKFVTDSFSMAGAVGIVPKIGQTTRLASSYGFDNAKRVIENNKEVFHVNLNDNASNNIVLNSIHYCIASPRINSDTWAMPEEYVYDNWKKIDNVQLLGNVLKLNNLTLPRGSALNTGYDLNTEHEIIFFRYLISNTTVELPFNSYSIGLPTSSSTGMNINSTVYPNYQSTGLYTNHRIDQIAIKNSAGNSGILTYKYRSSTPATSNSDYRAIPYNNFRIIHNNYYELENANGFPLFSTFIDDPNTGFTDKVFYGKRYNYSSIDSINGKDYYIPKPNQFTITEKDIDVPLQIGFYDYIIHGQTMNIYTPLYPQNFYYITGAINI